MSQDLQYAIDAVSLGSLYALLALGIGFIFGVGRIVNFAHGDFIMVSAYILLIVSAWAWPLAIVLVVAATVALALLVERLAFRPARKGDATTLLAVSLAVSLIVQSAALLLAGSRARTLDFGGWLTKPETILGLRVARLDVLTIATTAALLIGLAVFLRKTLLGVQLRAAAEDLPMARLLGVRANRVVAAAFGLSGMLAAVAGILIATQSGSLTPTLGVQPVLIAFTATVIGGLGSLSGSVAGGFVLGVLTVVLQVTLPDSAAAYRDSFVFALVIAILLLRPSGLVRATTTSERI
jgi:branched-chain amino acid transport system permease protein